MSFMVWKVLRLSPQTSPTGGVVLRAGSQGLKSASATGFLRDLHENLNTLRSQKICFVAAEIWNGRFAPTSGPFS